MSDCAWAFGPSWLKTPLEKAGSSLPRIFALICITLWLLAYRCNSSGPLSCGCVWRQFMVPRGAEKLPDCIHKASGPTSVWEGVNQPLSKFTSHPRQDFPQVVSWQPHTHLASRHAANVYMPRQEEVVQNFCPLLTVTFHSFQRILRRNSPPILQTAGPF